jgi:hypothetical protein
MGRSMSAPADVLPEAVGTMLRVYGAAYSAEYAIERHDGKVFHRETRFSPSGRMANTEEAEVRYVLGSGERGYSFLVERRNGLYQSPLSWYSQEKRWDLAPGYRKKNLHFDRDINILCLFCHTNRVDMVKNQAPVFHGLSIGCERCHGPGELHASRSTPEKSSGGKWEIVNPKHLESAALREDVCAQCHFLGNDREVKNDHSPFDYRPGLPLDEFIQVTTYPAKPGRGQNAVGHVEQMRRSRCYEKSDGRLGCTSCHDPHRVPTREGRVSYFRGRCLECHADRGCSLPSEDRLKQSPADDCTACHMPRAAVTNIPHTAQTDHAVPRGTAAAVENAGQPSSSH